MFLDCPNALANDVVIKEQSDQGIVIEFTPQQWRITSETNDGRAYFKVKFENCSFKTKSGQPLIPTRTLLIGIPFNAEVSCDILELKNTKRIEGKLLPTLTFSRDGIADIYYWEDPSLYQSQQIIPDNLVNISSPAVMRDQQVVMLDLHPVQFFPDKKQIQLYGKMVVRINFLNKEQEEKNNNISAFIPKHNRILVNPIQAAKWRKSRKLSIQQKLKKTNLGEFYKIRIQEEGIYKITGTELQQAGIDLRDIKPNQLKIFNNGGFQLLQRLIEFRPDSIIENAIIVSDGKDGKFDHQDYILFYGKSVNGWKYNHIERCYSHYLNPFTKENVYWLYWQDPNSGKRMKQKTITSSQSVIDVTNSCHHIYIENEYKNLLNSGMLWLGNYFSSAMPQRTYQWDLIGVLQYKEAMVRLNLAGISPGEHRFSLYLNNSFIARVPSFYGSDSKYLNIKMKQFYSSIQHSLKDGYNSLMIEYMPNSDESLAYLDWIELSFYRELMAQNDQLIFYSPDSANFYQYNLKSFSSDAIYVYDITNFSDVTQLDVISTGNGTAQFIDSCASNIPKQYLAITSEKFKSPLKIEKDTPSDLRNEQNEADFIIITYDDFYEAASALRSLRENCDTLKTAVVNISNVYDEFSWGLVDPTAIRDFIKYANDHWQKQPNYVLLFGDGNYDYKNIISSESNYIPSFQTSELDEILSRTRDDWYVCVAGNDNLMDLAIGRLPVKNPDQAMNVVKKIIEYENSPEHGEWCNTITMVADDEFEEGGGYDNIDHIPDADFIMENYIPKQYDIQKIYLTEYPAIKDASIFGIRKPSAHETLLKQINRGSLIINFIGHGNEQFLTHERILVVSDDMSRFDNGKKQAFWITATCNFGRFDRPDFQSFAEQLVIAARQGAIATFSPCRLAYPYQNVILNAALYRFLFDESEEQIRLGDAVVFAKNSLGNSENDQLYHLFGDPTLRLIMPTCVAQITKYMPDSMKALSKMNVVGVIQSQEAPLTKLQGQILFKAFDSRKERVHKVGNWKEWRYKLPGNTIFRGTTTVTNSQFRTQFIVPKDITYGGKEGRLSIFYWNEQLFGSGCLDHIYVGGTQTEFYDNEGPVIKIGFEGQNFMSGGFVPPNPILKLTVTDSLSGVNIGGDIGHKITMILDNARDKMAHLNDYFHYEQDSYTVGHISYPLTDFVEGMHHIQINAWDNCNNSSQAEVTCTVVPLDKLIIQDILNYPNPFSDYTEFTFWVNQDCDVEIKIYTLTGRLICKLDHLAAETGFNHFPWYALDQDGDALANGVYLYKVTASCFSGQRKIHAQQIEKFAIVR